MKLTAMPQVAFAHVSTPPGVAVYACPSAPNGRLDATRVLAIVFDPRTADAKGASAWRPPV